MSLRRVGYARINCKISCGGRVFTERCRTMPMRQLLMLPLCVAVSVAEGQESMAPGTLAAIKNATVYVKVRIGDGLATGSAWLMNVEGETGYLVTNHHVIADARGRAGAASSPVTVVFYSGTTREKSVPAEVLASQRQPDLAV